MWSKSKHWMVALASLSLCFLFCFPPEPELSKKFQWANIQPENTPTQKDFPEASAVFLVKEGNAWVNENGTTIVRHYIIKILNERGRKYGDVKLPFRKGVSSIEQIKARTIQPDGKIMESRADQIFEVTRFPEWALYSDEKAKVFTLPGIQDNSIIEYLYTEQYAWIRVPEWVFDEDEPVLLSKFTVNINRAVEYKVLKKQGSNVPIEENIHEEKSGFVTVAEYKCVNLPGIKTEPYMPPKGNLVNKVVFAPIAYAQWGGKHFLSERSWESLSQSYYKRIEAEINSTQPEMEDALSELTQGKSANFEKIKAVCDGLRNQLRYVSITSEEAGDRLHQAGSIFKNKYGNCSDMSVLLVGMLKRIGIDACYGLIAWITHGIVKEDFPNYYQFNHAVALIPAKYFEGQKNLHQLFAKGSDSTSTEDDYLVVDLTCDACRLGELPWYEQGVYALPIKENGAGLVITPIMPLSSNVGKKYAELFIDSVGSLEAKIKTAYQGQDAMQMRQWLKSQNSDQIEQWLQRSIKENLPRAELSFWESKNLSEMDSNLSLIYNFSAKNLMDASTGLLYIKPSIVSIAEKVQFSGEKRMYPVFFGYPRSLSTYCTITLPRDFEVKQMPSSAEKETPFGQFRVSYFQNGTQISIAQEFSRQSILIDVDKYPELKDFYDFVSQSNDQPIVLQKKKSNQ
jgi:hypothetical protein